MKYLMLIYGNQEKWASIPAGAWPEAVTEQDAFNSTEAAAGGYLEAARLATSLPERRYLAVQASRLEAAR